MHNENVSLNRQLLLILPMQEPKDRGTHLRGDDALTSDKAERVRNCWRATISPLVANLHIYKCGADV